MCNLYSAGNTVIIPNDSYFQFCFILSSQLKDMESLKDFGECIITIQACVIKKFLQGFMAPKQKKKKKQGGEDSSKAEEVDEEKRLAEEARVREQC